MRLFVSVNPGERFRADLAARLVRWRGVLDVAWTRPEAWHLTLQFLAEWPAERIPALQEALNGVCPQNAFSVQPGALGAFPDLARPRVLFLHMAGGGRLAKLAAKVGETVHGVWPDGPQDVRPFRAHLTLARVRRPLDQEAISELSTMDLGDFDPFPVDHISLMASELLPDGAVHRECAFYRLRKKGE